MKATLAPLLLGMLGCSPQYTQAFLGDWSLTSGVTKDVCPPPALSLSLAHKPGDTVLTIAELDREILSVLMTFPAPMGSSPNCNFTAVAGLDGLAQLQAKSCTINGTNHYDMLEGTLRLTPSGALEAEYRAVVGDRETCQRSESATFVPK